MATNVKPEVSKRNPYYLERNRYYELKHFCRQYTTWKKAYNSLTGLSQRPNDLALFSRGGDKGDPTQRCAEAREAYAKKIEMVEKCAHDADPSLYKYIMSYVTNGDGYSVLKMRDHIPCCKDIFYETARRFFWLLSKMRD